MQWHTWGLYHAAAGHGHAGHHAHCPRWARRPCPCPCCAGSWGAAPPRRPSPWAAPQICSGRAPAAPALCMAVSLRGCGYPCLFVFSSRFCLHNEGLIPLCSSKSIMRGCKEAAPASCYWPHPPPCACALQPSPASRPPATPHPSHSYMSKGDSIANSSKAYTLATRAPPKA